MNTDDSGQEKMDLENEHAVNQNNNNSKSDKRPSIKDSDENINEMDPTSGDTVQKDEDLVDAFPIVGIGASAGGLEAFKGFFTNLAPDCGMAFIIVQHLDPTHDSMLVDLIKRFTRMSVMQVEEGLKVVPNAIYIIPPNKDLNIAKGTLHLKEPKAPRGLRLPIDSFFRSLAKDKKDLSICIILSGTGTDGTLGLKAIKEEGGMTMVQDPNTSKYNGMPQSAINTGLVDYVLPIKKMPEVLISYCQLAFNYGSMDSAINDQPFEQMLNRIFTILKSKLNHDFSHYKKNTIIRRIERRMSINQIKTLPEYIKLFQKDNGEIQNLFRDLLIGVTNFFRDKESFASLETNAIMNILKNKKKNEPIRIWVPGCSTGEEAYTIAILVLENMEKFNLDFPIQIFGTDIDQRAITKAQAAKYPDNIVVDVSQERLNKFFVKEDNIFQIKKVVRDKIVFAVQNAITDPPFSNLDLISCRNLLIYLESNIQKKLIELFHYSLKPDSFLYLGTSESVGELSNLFTVIDRKNKLYQSNKDFYYYPKFNFPIIRAVPHHKEIAPTEIKGLKYKEVTEKILLERFSPSSIIINEKGDILYIHGKTGRFLEPAEGFANLNIFSMIRDGLRLELLTSIRRVTITQSEIMQKNILFPVDGRKHLVNLIIKPINKPQSLKGLILVIFQEIEAELDELTDVKTPPEIEGGSIENQRIEYLEQELKDTKEFLQTTIEQLETSNEELKSTNEELQSSNEELQSTNEELETSKEELQSINEELVTVNSELQNKIEELTNTNNDMNNLLSSTEIGTIFLDTNLKIRGFTPSVTSIISLIKSDIGRPISMFGVFLQDFDILREINVVLSELVDIKKEIQDRNEKWFIVRIKPYRTVENAVDGIVITFTDISELKRVQKKLGEEIRSIKTLNLCHELIATSQNPIQMIREMCKILVDTGGFIFAWVGIAKIVNDEKLVLPLVSYGGEEQYVENIRVTWDDEVTSQGPTGRAIKFDHPSVVQNILSDQSYSPWRSQATRRNFKSSIAIPLRINHQKAVLNVYAADINYFKEDEINLLVKLAELLSYGVKSLSIQKYFNEIRSDIKLITHNIKDDKQLEITKPFDKILSSIKDVMVLDTDIDMFERIDLNDIILNIAEKEIPNSIKFIYHSLPKITGNNNLIATAFSGLIKFIVERNKPSKIEIKYNSEHSIDLLVIKNDGESLDKEVLVSLQSLKINLFSSTETLELYKIRRIFHLLGWGFEIKNEKHTSYKINLFI